MIENRSGAVDVQRRAEFLRRRSQINFFTTELTIAVVKSVHGTV
jgi:hypothetical protein